MGKFLKQAGFSAVEFILILAVVGLVGFIGWRVYNQNKSVEPSESQSNTETPIQKAEDLDTEVNALNSQDIDEQLDTAELDAALE